jgi:lipoprotein signal peptidase
VDSVLGTVVVERAFDLLMSILVLCLLLLLQNNIMDSYMKVEEIQSFIERFEVGWVLPTILAVVLVLIVLYIIFKKRLSKVNVFTKFRDMMKRIGAGIMSVRRLSRSKLLIFMAMNFLIFGSYLMQTYVLFFALESTASCGIVDAMFMLVLSAIALTLPVQGGFGVYHIIVPSGFLVLGLTFNDGLTYATIAHESTALLYIVLGAISLVFVYLRKKPNPNPKPEPEIQNSKFKIQNS